MGIGTFFAKRKVRAHMRPGEVVVDYMPRVRQLDERAMGATATLVLTDQALYMLHDFNGMRTGGRLPLCLIDDVRDMGSLMKFRSGSDWHEFASSAPNGSFMGFPEKLRHWVSVAEPFDPQSTDLPELW